MNDVWFYVIDNDEVIATEVRNTGQWNGVKQSIECCLNTLGFETKTRGSLAQCEQASSIRSALGYALEICVRALDTVKPENDSQARHAAVSRCPLAIHRE